MAMPIAAWRMRPMCYLLAPGFGSGAGIAFRDIGCNAGRAGDHGRNIKGGGGVKQFAVGKADDLADPLLLEDRRHHLCAG